MNGYISHKGRWVYVKYDKAYCSDGGWFIDHPERSGWTPVEPRKSPPSNQRVDAGPRTY